MDCCVYASAYDFEYVFIRFYGRNRSDLMFPSPLKAIGLQEGWRSFQWISTIPPILLILGFKIYLNQTFVRQFAWYIPTDEEIRNAKVHSERADHKGSRLSKRFGHPALHAELFTPMLHARMMPLLRQVYNGRIKDENAAVEEYGGREMETKVLPGGVKIAAVHQEELEYDPAMYQRDRGEMDSDQKSMSSMNLLADAGSYYSSKQPYANSGGVGAGYEQYLAHGPTASDIEMSRLDSRGTGDQLPLLAEQKVLQQHPQTGYFDQMRYQAGTPGAQSQTSLPAYNHTFGSGFGYGHERENGSQASLPRYPPGVPVPQASQPQYPQQVQYGLYGEREAPIHRPQQNQQQHQQSILPSRSYTPTQSPSATSPYDDAALSGNNHSNIGNINNNGINASNGNSSGNGNGNLAGRGARRTNY